MAAILALGLASGTPACRPKAKEDAPPSNSIDQNKMLLEFPLSSYVGKPVDSLLQALPAYDEFNYVDNGRPGILDGAQFRFGDRWLRVGVGELKHLQRFDAKYAWDFASFRKETIASLRWMD